jgi:hypothetical protein
MTNDMLVQPEDLREEEWWPRIVYIRVLATGLHSPRVPFAVLKDDPVPEFRRAVEQLRYQGMPLDDETLRALWNGPLHALEARQRFFVMAWSSVAAASPLMTDLSGLS